MKVGTHKKSVIALWVVLIASVSFGVYKNFTAIDQHTTHEVETIQLRLNDTNGIENFVKNFAESYYTWSNSKATSSTVTDVLIWDVEQSAYYVEETILEPINGDYLFSSLSIPYSQGRGQCESKSVAVKFIDDQTKALQVSQYALTLHKDSNWKL